MVQLERRRFNDEQPEQTAQQTEQKTATQEVTSQQVASPHVMETYRRMHGGIKPQQQQTVAPPTAPKVPENLKVKKAERKAQSQVTPDEGFYTKLFKEENARIKPLTDKELEQQAKKQKREKIFAAIGDGISALSNLYFTTQYAPNVEQKPMSDKVKERWDKLDAERKGNEKAWYEGYVNALRLDDAKAAQLRKEKADEKAYDLRVKEYQRKVDKDKMDADLWELERERKEHLIDKAEYEARLAKIKADYHGKYGFDAKVGGSTKQKTSKWIAYNQRTGEKITIDASSKAHAWSQVPEGYVIREAPEKTTTTVEDTPLGKTTKTTTKTEGKSSGGYKKTTEETIKYTPKGAPKNKANSDDIIDWKP
jgi:hypothetical protein